MDCRMLVCWRKALSESDQFPGAIFQALLGLAQSLFHALAFRHLRGQKPHAGKETQPLQGVPQQQPGFDNGTGIQGFGPVPNQGGDHRDEHAGPASDKPGHKNNRDEVKIHQRDHGAGDVIQLSDVNHHDQPHHDQSRMRLAVEVLENLHQSRSCCQFIVNAKRCAGARQSRGKIAAQWTSGAGWAARANRLKFPWILM